MNNNWKLEAQSLLDWIRRIRLINPFSGYPLHRNENISPFFIIGSGRSGNTLLRRILYSHTSLHIPPETYVLGSAIKFFSVNRNLFWRDLVYATLSQFEYYPEFETFDISLRSLAQRLVQLPCENRSLAFMLDAFYRYHAEQHAITCQRWGDKTPMNTFALDRIYSVFPKAQFIHIIRDGCDVVASYLQAGIYVNIVKAAERWVSSIESARKFISFHPENCLEIRYEELVDNPQKSVEGLCHFLKIDFQAQMLTINETINSMGDVAVRAHHQQIYQPISKSSIGKGRQSLTLEEKELLEPILDPLLSKLDYNLCIS